MITRLGDVLYWAGCVLSALTLLFGILVGMMMMDTKDQVFATFVGALTAAITWAVGRACRYVLAGK